MKIGIFGGSFNPIHQGHILLAKTALSELNLDKVIFVPSFQTPLKKAVLFLPTTERVRFLKAAIRAHKRFELSDWEIKREKLTYTIETLKHFRRLYGPKTSLYFLAGADTLKNLSRWKSISSVLKSCRFCVFSRPGHKLDKSLSGRICWVPMEAVDVSATDLRRRVMSGMSVDGLVPNETKPLFAKWLKGEMSSTQKRRSR